MYHSLCHRSARVSCWLSPNAIYCWVTAAGHAQMLPGYITFTRSTFLICSVRCLAAASAQQWNDERRPAQPCCRSISITLCFVCALCVCAACRAPHSIDRTAPVRALFFRWDFNEFIFIWLLTIYCWVFIGLMARPSGWLAYKLEFLYYCRLYMDRDIAYWTELLFPCERRQWRQWRYGEGRRVFAFLFDYLLFVHVVCLSFKRTLNFCSLVIERIKYRIVSTFALTSPFDLNFFGEFFDEIRSNFPPTILGQVAHILPYCVLDEQHIFYDRICSKVVRYGSIVFHVNYLSFSFHLPVDQW